MCVLVGLTWQGLVDGTLAVFGAASAQLNATHLADRTAAHRRSLRILLLISTYDIPFSICLLCEDQTCYSHFFIFDAHADRLRTQ